MSWSWTLYRYLAAQFLIGVAIIYAVFLTMALSIDIVNLLNRTAGHSVPTATVIGMAVLQLPELGQKMLPFAILLGGVFTFVRLARIARTGGDAGGRRLGLGFPVAAPDAWRCSSASSPSPCSRRSPPACSPSSPAWKRAMSKARKASSRSR